MARFQTTQQEEAPVGTFAERVLAGMAMVGIRSATGLGKKLGISRQHASRIVNGEVHHVSTELLIRMARLFGVSGTWLQTGDGSPSPKEVLDPDEQLLLEQYRLGTIEEKEEIMEFVCRIVRH